MEKYAESDDVAIAAAQSECTTTVAANRVRSSAELAAYPSDSVIESRSPAVSPRVVAQIFITQKASVMLTTLFAAP